MDTLELLLTALRQLEEYLGTLPKESIEYTETKLALKQLKRTLVVFSSTRLGEQLFAKGVPWKHKETEGHKPSERKPKE